MLLFVIWKPTRSCCLEDYRRDERVTCCETRRSHRARVCCLCCSRTSRNSSSSPYFGVRISRTPNDSADHLYRDSRLWLFWLNPNRVDVRRVVFAHWRRRHYELFAWNCTRHIVPDAPDSSRTYIWCKSKRSRSRCCVVDCDCDSPVCPTWDLSQSRPNRRRSCSSCLDVVVVLSSYVPVYCHLI